MKVLSILLCVAGLTFAQFPSKKTTISINEPLLVAGVPQVTLAPGKYVIKVVNSETNRNIVRIYNEREDKLITTVLAINNYRMKPTDKTILRYWETPRGNPPALRAWFPPGDEWGQEFVYPKGLATILARDTGGPVLTARVTTEAELTTAPVTQVEKSGEEKPLAEAYVEPQVVAQARPPAQAPPPVQAQTAPEPTVLAQNTPPAAEPIPATGSPVFAIGLAGLLMGAAGYAMRRTLVQRS